MLKHKSHAGPHLIFDAAQDVEVLLRDLPSEHLNVLEIFQLRYIVIFTIKEAFKLSKRD